MGFAHLHTCPKNGPVLSLKTWKRGERPFKNFDTEVMQMFQKLQYCDSCSKSYDGKNKNREII